MSRASQRNALLIQHCYSPYRTTQFEKTIKKRQKGPVLAIKGPFGDLGGPDLVPTAPHWPAWVGLMVTTHFDLVLGPFWAPGGPKRAHFGPNVPNFHGPIFVGYFLCSKYSLVGCPEHHNGTPCSSSTVTASGTTTEFCIPDHWVQAAVMVKIRTFKLNPDLFRTTF